MRAAAWLQGGPEGCRVGRKGLLGHMKQSGPSFEHFSKGVVLPVTPSSNSALKWPGVPSAAVWGCAQGSDSRAWFSRGWRVPVPITGRRRLRADGPTGGGPAGDGERTPGGTRVAVPPSPCAGPRKCSLQLQGTVLPMCREEQTHVAPRSVGVPAPFRQTALRAAPREWAFPPGG